MLSPRGKCRPLVTSRGRGFRPWEGPAGNRGHIPGAADGETEAQRQVGTLRVPAHGGPGPWALLCRVKGVAGTWGRGGLGPGPEPRAPHTQPVPAAGAEDILGRKQPFQRLSRPSRLPRPEGKGPGCDWVGGGPPKLRTAPLERRRPWRAGRRWQSAFLGFNWPRGGAGCRSEGRSRPGLAPSPGASWASQVFAQRDGLTGAGGGELPGASRPPVGVSQLEGWAGGLHTRLQIPVSCGLGLPGGLGKPPQRPALAARRCPGAAGSVRACPPAQGLGAHVPAQHRPRQVGAPPKGRFSVRPN